jgi:putative phage-type endonuclease
MKPIVICSTKNMPEEKWLELRKVGIGGSDASAALRENPWQSPVKLWLIKTGQEPDPDLSDNEAVQMGRVLEDTIAKLFTERTGKKVRNRHAMFRHPDHPFMIANIDREVVGENIGLECKNVGLGQSKYWKDDEVPDHYYIQVQHYCAVMGWDGCWIAVLIGGQRFVHKYIPRDDEFIEWMIRGEAAFWKHVTDRTMPAVDGSDSCSETLGRMFPEAKPETVELAPTIGMWIRVRQAAIEKRDEADAEVAEAENFIKQALGEFAYGTIEGVKVAAWTPVAGRKTIDSKALEKDHPEIYAKYLKTGNPTRRFSVFV